MTPAELIAILDRLGLTQIRASQCLGVDDRTMRRWMKGDAAVPEPVARILRMADGHGNFNDAHPFHLGHLILYASEGKGDGNG